jgi:hypothetical protein
MMSDALSRDFLIQLAHQRELSSREEQLLVLRFNEGKSYEDIAEQLNTSLATCMKSLSRLYQKFEIPGDSKGKENKLRLFLIEQSRRASASAPSTSEQGIVEQLKSELKDLRQQVADLHSQQAQSKYEKRSQLNGWSGGYHLASDDLQEIGFVGSILEELIQLRDRLQEEFRTLQEHQAKTIADSLHSHISNLKETFELDFRPYQPKQKLFDFLHQGKRQDFEALLQLAFMQYISDQITAWNQRAQRDLEETFVQLAHCVTQYSAAYGQLTQKLSEHIAGQKADSDPDKVNVAEDKPPKWVEWATEASELLIGVINNLAGIAEVRDLNQEMTFNSNIIVAVNPTLSTAPVTMLGALGEVLTVLGISSGQAEFVFEKLLQAMKEELKQSLPQVAQEKSRLLHRAITDCLEAYQTHVIQLINADIQTWKTRLNRFLKQ